MLEKVRTAWNIKELRKKILITLLFLFIFRVGCAIPVPFVTKLAISSITANEGIFGYMNMLSGGALSRCAFFALGVSPYINASIITQLLCVALPSWEKLQKETTGKKQLDNYTKRIAMAMGAVMSVSYYMILRNIGVLKYSDGFTFETVFSAAVISAVFFFGSQICVWLGGRIDEYGIGNGVSLIIFAGIVSRWDDFRSIVANVQLHIANGNWGYVLVAVLAVVIMLASICFVVYSDGAEKRLPVIYASRTAGRQMNTGKRDYIPIKLLISGVMPIIFSGVIMSLVTTLHNFVSSRGHETLAKIIGVFASGGVLYYAVYVLLIALFNFFYVSIQFDAIAMANNLRKQNGTIPGIRPGAATSKMVGKNLNRMALTSSFYLALIALTPMVFSAITGIYMSFGGTSIMIVAGVALEVVRSINGYMTVRRHKGFLE